jgi:glycosyltransferase involved in cell wall biosynthesis
MSSQPLVSVVTPFYNTADYLAECIESVLSQTYSNFEYLLVDNRSTDGSGAIAASYAAKDGRVRLIQNTDFVGQVANYNGAARHVSRDARYVKFVLADDVIFPECLERMVAVAEANPTASIVSSYYLHGTTVRGSGVEWPRQCIPGTTANRMHLLQGHFLYGSPTTLMYRADVVKNRDPFFSESSLHEDTELCHEVMSKNDLGFVHQVLSFTRVGNGGVLSKVETYHWQTLDFYITLRKYGPCSLSRTELAERLRGVRGEYLQLLGESALLGREPAFWHYHQKGLATIGEELPSPVTLTPHVIRAFLKTLIRPSWFFAERSRLRKSVKAERQNGSRPSSRA